MRARTSDGKRQVTIDGQKTRGTPGFHQFVAGNPPRIVCLIRAFRCDACYNPALIWMTDDERWRQIPRRWWRTMLCVYCFRGLVPRR